MALTLEKDNRLRSMVISAVFAALALVLPPAFHAAGLGSKFLPLLLPLLVNGFFVPVEWAVFTGVAAPLISSFASGMPPIYPPVAIAMALEGAILGGIASAIYGRGRRLWLALIVAIICGRITSFGSSWGLAWAFSLPSTITATAWMLQGLPGVALQLVVVPIAVRQLSKSRSILFIKHDEA